MADFPGGMAELHAQTQETRYQFLKVELLTCFTAIEFANTNVELGNREVAAQEVRSAQKGSNTIRRFLPGLDSKERRDEIEAGLGDLRDLLDSMRNKLGMGSADET